jgi:hypothetical protein
MGDTGSLIIGFLLSMFALKFIQLNIEYRFNPNASFSAPILAIFVLIVPIFDTLRVFIVRLKDKKSPFVGDRNHLHHILIDSGLSHFQTSVILWSFTLISTVLFLTISKKTDNTTSLYILVVLFAIYMWISHSLKHNNKNRQLVEKGFDSQVSDSTKNKSQKNELATS